MRGIGTFITETPESSRRLLLWEDTYFQTRTGSLGSTESVRCLNVACLSLQTPRNIFIPVLQKLPSVSCVMLNSLTGEKWAIADIYICGNSFGTGSRVESRRTLSHMLKMWMLRRIPLRAQKEERAGTQPRSQRCPLCDDGQSDGRSTGGRGHSAEVTGC